MGGWSKRRSNCRQREEKLSPITKLFKQQITRYMDEQGHRCSKNTPGAKRLVEESAKWYGQYKTNNRWRRVALSTDKGVSQKRLAQLVASADSSKFKLTDPYAEHRKRSLVEHLDDYATALRAKDRKTEYVSKQVQRIRDGATECGFEYLHDIDELKLAAYLKCRRGNDPVEVALTKIAYSAVEVAKLLGKNAQAVFRVAQRHDIACEGEGRKRTYPSTSVQKLIGVCGRGLSTSSSNGYAFAFKGFARWAVRTRRLEDDPLKGLETLNAKKDRRHKRRTLPIGDFQKFLDAARTGSEFRGLKGSDRVVIYFAAVYTGLRAQEIAALTPSHFDPEFRTVTVRAAETKNGSDSTLPLRKELATTLREYLRGRQPNVLIWPGNWSQNAAEIVRTDLSAAGLPYWNEKHEVFDFHSLRRQFISNLVWGKVHPKVVQQLARHSTIQMTMDIYAELSEGNELATAIAAMPGYHPVTQTPVSSGQQVAASGTEGEGHQSS